MTPPEGSGQHRLSGPPASRRPAVSNDPRVLVALLGQVGRALGDNLDLRGRLRKICDLLQRASGAERVSIYLVASDGHRAVECLDAEDPRAENVVVLDDWVVRSGAPDRAHRAFGQLDERTAAWCQPVKRNGQLLAVLYLEGGVDWSDTVPSTLEAVAEILGTAIATQHRFDELQRHATLAEIVGQVSRVALEGGSLDELLHRVVSYLEQRLEVTIASILLLSEDKKVFELEVYSGSIPLETPAGGSWPVEVGVCGRAVRTGKPQLILDVHADPDYVPGNPEVQSEYIVPIRHHDEILGVLNLESTRRDLFSPQALTVFDHIADQVAGAIHLANLNRSLEAVNRELARLSALDGLTGLSNRRRFDEALAAAWGRAGRRRRWLSVILADLDCFKLLNDTHGHQYGDDCLRRVAQVLSELGRRSGDTVARYGGEEFALVLEESTAEESLALAEELRRRVEQLAIPHHGSTIAPNLTISVGVAGTRPREGVPARVLLEAADAALYEAKGLGRNRVCERRLAGG